MSYTNNSGIGGLDVDGPLCNLAWRRHRGSSRVFANTSFTLFWTSWLCVQCSRAAWRWPRRVCERHTAWHDPSLTNQWLWRCRWSLPTGRTLALRNHTKCSAIGSQWTSRRVCCKFADGISNASSSIIINAAFLWTERYSVRTVSLIPEERVHPWAWTVMCWMPL